MRYEQIKTKALELARKKLNLDGNFIPRIVKKKSRWSSGLLRHIVEFEVKIDDKTILTTFDEETDESIGWRYPNIPIGSKTLKINKEDAVEIAKSEIDSIPQEAVLKSVECLNRGSPGFTYFVLWKHFIENIEVEGDFISVKINPETREIISVTINWSKIQNEERENKKNS